MYDYHLGIFTIAELIRASREARKPGMTLEVIKWGVKEGVKIPFGVMSDAISFVYRYHQRYVHEISSYHHIKVYFRFSLFIYMNRFLNFWLYTFFDSLHVVVTNQLGKEEEISRWKYISPFTLLV